MSTPSMPSGTPLAAPETRPLSAAEPAKLIGWLLLAAFGLLNAVFFAGSPNPVNLVLGAVSLTVLAGFVQAHRHPGGMFARLWIGFFGGLLVLGYLYIKVVDILTV